MGEQEATCEHPERMRGAWTEYIAGSRWRIGWCCAACGHVKETGTSPGKPHWAVGPKP